MRRLLLHRGTGLLLAAAGTASLALAGCGGGSDSPTAGAPGVVQAIAQASTAAADGPDEHSPSAEEKLQAADAGAASQEPQ